MSDKKAPETGEIKANPNPPEGHEVPVVPWPAWKTVVLIAIALCQSAWSRIQPSGSTPTKRTRP